MKKPTLSVRKLRGLFNDFWCNSSYTFLNVFKVQNMSSGRILTDSETSQESEHLSTVSHRQIHCGEDSLSKTDTKLSQKQATLSSNLTFVSQTNPVTGKMDWVVRQENYDYLQEIARSGYGDMLHDKDRNDKYYKAIKKAINYLKGKNKKVKCLDIGTGTGLLSMMAAKSNADVVTACEAFEPMASCAEQVLKANGLKDRIQLIHKRSTDVSLDDVGERANLLVTELFDTELIGEGAIESYTDAHARLMEEECVAVPAKGIMYVQAVQCDLLNKCNILQPIQLPNSKHISTPSSFTHCTGALNLHDLQVDELEDHLQFLSPPVEVFRFDFSHRNALKKEEHNKKTVFALQNGQVHAFVMWWDLVMDPQEEIVLSCAPCWIRAKKETIPWRDHWMQALYYPSSSLVVEKDKHFDIYCFHDEYSLCFDTVEIDRLRPSCSCGFHVAFSRSRLGQINDCGRNEIFIKALEKHVTDSTVCLVISDGSLLPLIAAHLGARKVFYLDNNWSSRKVMKNLIAHNNLQDRVTVLEKQAEDITEDDFENMKIDIIIAEPYFHAALLPWEHLYFWYAVNTLCQHLSQDSVILPEEMVIKAMAVQFRDLHKIRAPVGNCEGFDITDFDKLIEMASQSADDDIEPQPLWEYPAKGLSQPASVMTVTFSGTTEKSQKIQHSSNLAMSREGTLNGIVFWSEFSFGDGLIVSNGLVHDSWEDKKLKWDMNTKQAVKLLRHGSAVTSGDLVKIYAQFTPENGDFSFQVDIHSKSQDIL